MITAYPTLRFKLTMPQALKLQFLPAIPGSNATAAADRAEQAAQNAQSAANTAVAATANKVDKAGDVMTGFLQLNADPVANLQAATKQYVDTHSGTGGIPEAPNDGVLYGRQSLAWTAAQPLDADLTSLAAAAATNAIYYRSAANTWATVTIGANLTFTGGTLAATGGGGAPVGAEYITSTADATLTAERVLTDTATITWDRTTPGQIKASTAAGGGNVSNSGTPTAGQYGKWVTATTIQGVAPATVLSDIGAAPLASPVFTGDPQAPTPVTADNDTSIATTAFVKAQAYAPLASPTFTGDPKAPTATAGDNDTSVATTAFVTAAIAAIPAGGSTVSAPQGRLTLQSATPVMTTTQSAKTTLFYTPYVGNQIVLYNGTSMVPTTFSELSVLTTDTTKSPAAIGASKCNDWYVWDDAGTLRLSHDLDWTNDTTRTAGHFPQMINGIWVNNVGFAGSINGPATQRGTYVGTTRSNASSQLDWIYGAISAGGQPSTFGVWNAYNRVRVVSMEGDNTSNWSYAGTIWRMLNIHVEHRHNAVFGLQEDPVELTLGAAANTTGAINFALGIGVDSITVPSGQSGFNQGTGVSTAMANYKATHLGFHFFQALEFSSGASATIFGVNASAGTQMGFFFSAMM